MFARTERLLLRPGWIEDAPALTRAIADEAIVTKLARAPWPYRLADAEAFLARRPDVRLPDFLIFARTRGAPRLVGGIGLHESDRGAAELGYWIARPFWGLGFATEAGRAVVDLARHSLKLPKLVSSPMIDNPASGRVLRKIGFKPVGRTVPRHSVARGSEVPCMLYALDAGDVANRPMTPALAA